MTAFSREIKLERAFKEHQIRNSFMESGLTSIDLAGIIGFVLFIVSCFFTFTPISDNNWLKGPMGMAPLLFSFVGIVALYKKNYFAAFFIAMFNAFFLTLEIIITYDSKAVQMGRELGADGWFRPVLMVFSDALKSDYGAFWGIFGSVLAVLAIMIAWVYENHKFNVFTAENATDDPLAYDSYFEDVADKDFLEMDTEPDEHDASDDEYGTPVDSLYGANTAYSGSPGEEDKQAGHISQIEESEAEAEVSLVSILPAANTTVELGAEIKFSPEARDSSGRLISSDPADFIWTNADENGVFKRTTTGVYAVSAEYKGRQSNTTVVSVE